MPNLHSVVPHYIKLFIFAPLISGEGQISAAALHIAPDVGGDGQSGTCAYRIVAGSDMHRLLQLCEEKHYICGKHSTD